MSAAVLSGQANILTWHNDNARTGQNLQETILTPANVNSTTFGRLATLTVDGKVDAQPLYVSAVTIPSQGIHNVLYVATENDSLYAFDADTFAQLLQVSLLGAGEAPSDNHGCTQITPEIGISATPAIDLQAGPHGTIYAIGQSKDSSGNYHQRLHALDLTTLTEQFSGPVTIQASFPGSGAENTFNPAVHVERPALLISNGVVYTSWGSHCDGEPYAGWVLSYSETTLAQVGVLNVAPNGSQGGVWGAGSGPAADGNGHIFLLTGNGTFDTTLNSSGFPSQGDFGNAFLRIPTSGALSVADYFTMDNTVAESNGDVDLGSGGLMLLPALENAQGTPVSLVVGAGKDSNIYVLDRTDLGGFHPSTNSIYQQMSGALPSGAWSSPAWFNGTLYYGGVSDHLKAFTFTGGLFSLTSESANTFQYPGTTPSISANGTSNGIVWIVENQTTAVLHAFSANNVATELYNTNQAAGGRDQFGPGNKFIVPTIANGKVYVGTTTGVGVFGLLAGSPTLTISMLVCNPASLGPNASSTCTVTLSGPAPTGGATVTLTNSNSTLTVPASVTVAAAATSVSFSTTTAAIGSNQTATITATYNSTSANATISLTAPVQVSSLVCNPTSLGPNSSSTCTITLTQAAPTGGAAVTLTNTNATLTVPASVAVAAAALSATFSATTVAIASNQSATITAAYNSTSANATISLVASVRVSSLACNPTSLGPNSSSTCTVTLTQAAPTGGAAVTLTNTNATLTAPASVTVAAAALSATFNATTAAIASSQSATITAAYNGSSANATISLTAVMVSSLACNPTSLGPGAVSACTVTLTLAAPTGGSNVTLASNNTSLTVPSSVTVAAGAATGAFSASAAASIASNQSAMVTATLGSSSQTATLSLVATVTPITFVQSKSTAQTEGQTASAAFTASVSSGDVIIVGVFADLGAPVSVTDTLGDSFTQVAHQTVASDHDADVFVAMAGAAGTDRITVNAGSGKNVYAFSIHEYRGVTTVVDASVTAQGNSMAPASGNVTTTAPNDLVFAWFTNGSNFRNEYFPSLASSFTKREMTGSGTTLCYAFANCVESGDLMAGTALTTNATATLNVSDIWSATVVAFHGAASTLLVCSPTSLGPNSSSTCTVTLSQAAPTGGARVTLTNTNTTLTVPASVTVPAAATSASFSATTAAIGSNQSATITATYSGVSANTTISLVAPALVSSLVCNPTSLGPNSSSTCAVTLTQPAPTGGAAVTLTNTNATLTVPASVTVAAAALSATFSATTAAIGSNQSSTITATYGGGSANATISLVAPSLVSSLVCNPTSLGPNSSSTCTVALTQAAPTGGARVTLTNTNTTLTVPASVTVPAAATSASFSATTAAIGSNQSATITATYGGGSANATISLVAPSLVSSLVCNPTSLGPNSSSTCAVALTQPAPTGGAAVTLTNTNATLSAPASVMVAASAMSGSFNATTAVIGSNQSATITAAYNSSSANATISLMAVTVSSLVCNPTSLGQGAVSACTVTLTGTAPTGGSNVTLASNNTSLTVPSSVTVAAGAASASFNATAAASIASNQSAMVTATLGSSSQTATISLVATVTPITFVQSKSTAQTEGQTASAAFTASVSSGDVIIVGVFADLGAPVSVTDTLGDSFTQVAHQTVASDHDADVFVAMAGAAGTDTITVNAGSGKNVYAFSIHEYRGVTTAVDASVTAQGSSKAVASGNVTTITANDLVFAWFTNGSNFRNEYFPSLAATFTKREMTGSGTTLCYAFANCVESGDLVAGTALTTNATATLNVSDIWSATVVAFQGAASNSSQAVAAVSASVGLNSVSRPPAERSQLTTGTVQASTLSCSPDSSSAGTLRCTVQLSQAPPPNGVTVTLRSNSSRVQVPGQLVIPAGSQSATVTAQVSASDRDEQAQISASMEGAASTTSPTIDGIRPTAITCPTEAIRAGSWFDCEVQMNSPNIPQAAALVASSANPGLKMPVAMASRPGQTRLGFRVYADPRATSGNSAITVQFGETSVSAAVSVTPASGPVLSIPGEVDAVFGKQTSFTVSAVDPAGLPVVLAASGLPDGATFDAGTGRFAWTPAQSQQGVFRIAVIATNSEKASSMGNLTLVVDSGNPVITDVRNAASMTQPACSPGSVATLTGRWLTSSRGPVSDPSGAVTDLAGTQVKVNGESVPVVYASATRVDFVCPGTNAGTALAVSAENAAGIAAAQATTMYQTAPGLYSADGTGTGQGVITLAGTTRLAASRDYMALGQPAVPGGSITIRATGIGALNGALPLVMIGDVNAQVKSVQAVTGVAGVYEIMAEVPLSTQVGDAVPVVVVLPNDESPGARGFGRQSNKTSIAVERP